MDKLGIRNQWILNKQKESDERSSDKDLHVDPWMISHNSKLEEGKKRERERRTVGHFKRDNHLLSMVADELKSLTRLKSNYNDHKYPG
jgi:hypothetical protein